MFCFCIYARRWHQTILHGRDNSCPRSGQVLPGLASALPSASSLRRETARLRLPDMSFCGGGLQQSRAQQREAAPGLLLCAHCGAAQDAGCDCEDEKIESPFSALAELKAALESERRD